MRRRTRYGGSTTGESLEAPVVNGWLLRLTATASGTKINDLSAILDRTHRIA